MIGFNNGVYQDLSLIGIPITSISINRGYGAYEFFEVLRGRPFFGQRHMARFARSLEILKLKIDFLVELPDIVKELVHINNLNHTYIKIFALPHTEMQAGFYQAALYVFPASMPALGKEIYQNGAKLITRNFQRFLPEAKSTNYLAGQYWNDQQSDPAMADILFHNGTAIRETSRGNVFVVKGGRVVTPGQEILYGISRSIVLEILEKAKIPHVVQDVSLELLLSADEVFTTNTTRMVVPITAIDGVSIGKGMPGPITQRVMVEFQKIRAEYQ